jgi:hypothetical protein
VTVAKVRSGSNPVLRVFPLYVRLGAASGIARGTVRCRIRAKTGNPITRGDRPKEQAKGRSAGRRSATISSRYRRDSFVTLPHCGAVLTRGQNDRALNWAVLRYQQIQQMAATRLGRERPHVVMHETGGDNEASGSSDRR